MQWWFTGMADPIMSIMSALTPAPAVKNSFIFHIYLILILTIGWNGWLYPVLFIVLPIVACLMVLALIACNVYEYYLKKKRLQQYQHYSQNPVADPEPEKRPEICSELDSGNGFNGYNESQFTYSTIFGNYVSNEENRPPVRPMSGWVAPHIWMASFIELGNQVLQTKLVTICTVLQLYSSFKYFSYKTNKLLKIILF